jgi:PAS domain S-box-containing protein
VAAWVEAVEQRKPFIFEHRLKQKDGRWGQFSIRAIPALNADGTVREWVGVHTDVTQQRQAEAALWESQQRFSTLAADLPNMVWSMNPDRSIDYVNPQVLEYFGLSLDEFYRFDHKRLFHPAEAEHVMQAMKQAIYEAQPFSIEFRLRRHDGAYRWFLVKGSPSIRANGEVSGYVGSCTDIHQQKVFADQLEQKVADRTRELVKANEALRRSNEYLQQFAYVASHDLQEPLRKIQTFGDLLMAEHADVLGEGTGYLERINAAAGRMATLIRDLLNYSRISTQDDCQEPVSLNAVMDAVLSDLELVITETGAEITVQPLPAILGDRRQLGQLMQNLLSNALKFRRLDKAGGLIRPVVAIGYQRIAATDLPASVHPARQAKAYHRIDVIDNGIGFEEKYADRIFEVFQRLHGKRAYPGTGIGLAICEKVVANHGGAISATSQPSLGATFQIYLPENTALAQAGI